ncbi:MAG: hypothetical protein QOD52_1659, partial [Gaiellaceae bacterium]|nr:hypothetical protein [Gaiellaceae bacterium]
GRDVGGQEAAQEPEVLVCVLG